MARRSGPDVVVHDTPELVASAVRRGTWARQVVESSARAAATKPVPAHVVHDAAVAFRQARALESGDRLRAWLDEPAHCDALFDRRVQEIGVGHSRSDPGTPGSRGGPDGIGWVVVLGEREPE